MTQWLCSDCGHIFLWNAFSTTTRPNHCPKCLGHNVDVREV